MQAKQLNSVMPFDGAFTAHQRLTSPHFSHTCWEVGLRLAKTSIWGKFDWKDARSWLRELDSLGG
jgi:hypothetical protein